MPVEPVPKGILPLAAVCTLFLAACAPRSANDRPGAVRGSVPYIYLTFGEYAELIEGCDETKIRERLDALDVPSLPRIPIMGIRLCRPGLLVLDYQGMWATQEFKIIAPGRRKFYALALQRGGTRCTTGDGCDVVSDEECDDDPDCQHFRLVQLTNQSGIEITSAFIRSRETPTVTDDDFAGIGMEGEEKTLYFHLGGKAYVSRDGVVGER